MNKSIQLFFSNYKTFLPNSLCQNQLRKYAAAAPSKVAGGLGGKVGGSKKKGAEVVKKVEIEVEKDAKKLAKFCCGLNIFKTGGEEVEIKANSDYPDWLWNLKSGKGPTLDEMTPNTLEWWSRKRRLALRHKHKLMKNQFPQPFIPKNIRNMLLP